LSFTFLTGGKTKPSKTKRLLMAVIERRYFDWAATAPVVAEATIVAEGAIVPEATVDAEGAIVPEATVDAEATVVAFGNPSSLHAEGREARDSLEKARLRCAKVLGVRPETLYFTSGGTESNAIAIHSLLFRPGRAACLYAAAEHPSVRENCRVLERLGKPVGVIPVEADGRVSETGLAKALEKYPDTRFAAIMAVNNETGTINDIRALSVMLRSRQNRAPIHLHCDLVQAVGKVPVNIAGWDLDSASVSAHKLGGPRGIGILYLKKPLEVLYQGGGQERGIRAGTENTAGALALAACLERYAGIPGQQFYHDATERLALLMRSLEANDRYTPIPLDRRDPGDQRFSPYILQAAFDGVPGEVMARALDQAGFAISTGSACSSSTPRRPVLEAMGLAPKLRLEGIRISQGWSTTARDVSLLALAIGEALKFL
jgi:cysteine desulfurase